MPIGRDDTSSDTFQLLMVSRKPKIKNIATNLPAEPTEFGSHITPSNDMETKHKAMSYREVGRDEWK